MESQLRSQRCIPDRVSVRTVTQRLNNTGMNARRPDNRPTLSLRHKQARLLSARDRRIWNLQNWLRSHWLDEGIFCYVMFAVD